MWIKDTSNEERKTLTAAFAGYATDAFDYMISPVKVVIFCDFAVLVFPLASGE